MGFWEKKQRKENIYEIDEPMHIEDTNSIMIKNYEKYEYYDYDRNDDEDKKDIISSEKNKQKKYKRYSIREKLDIIDRAEIIGNRKTELEYNLDEIYLEKNSLKNDYFNN